MEYDNYKPRRAKKPMTEQQALLKLTTLCTQAEHCSQEMLDKMKKWELSEEAIARNMEFLTQKKFVDDERFARFFINDKIKYNKWGRRKVEQALYINQQLAELYYDKGKFGNAGHAFAQCIEYDDSDNPLNYYNAAQMYMADGDELKARLYLRIFLQKAPKMKEGTEKEKLITKAKAQLKTR